MYICTYRYICKYIYTLNNTHSSMRKEELEIDTYNNTEKSSDTTTVENVEENTKTTSIKELLKINIGKAAKKQEKRSRKKAQQIINQACKTKDIKRFNKIILELGNKQMLGYAIKAYDEICKLKLEPNVYTFTNLINACSRVGDSIRAQKYLQEMKDLHIEPNEVTYTALMKVLAIDNLEQAYKVWYTYDNDKKYVALYPIHIFTTQILKKASKDQINIRTYNTLLRGQYQNGNIEIGEKVWKRIEKDNKYKPDITSLDIMCRQYCLYQNTEKAEELLQEMEEIIKSNDTTRIYYMDTSYDILRGSQLYLANAKAQKNDCHGVWVLLQKIRQAKSSKVQNSNTKRFRSDNNINITREYSNNNNNEDTFINLRSSEQDISCEILEHWQQHVASRLNESISKIEIDTVYQKLPYLYTGIHSVDGIVPLQIQNRVLCIKKIYDTINTNNIKVEQGITPNEKKKILKQYTQVWYDSDKTWHGQNWEKIFLNTNPICVELCSGNGEWIVERARQHPNINWIAIETRYERVWYIYLRMSLLYLRNIFIIYGDAKIALQECFIPNTIQCIFINYPEPPIFITQNNTFIDENLLRISHKLLIDNKHRNLRTLFGVQHGWQLSSSSFTTEQKITNNNNNTKKLRKNTEENTGSIIIVTDDQILAGSIVRLFKDKFESLYTTRLDDSMMYDTKVPKSYGTSFYNRFWCAGHKSLRFFFHMRKLLT